MQKIPRSPNYRPLMSKDERNIILAVIIVVSLLVTAFMLIPTRIVEGTVVDSEVFHADITGDAWRLDIETADGTIEHITVFPGVKGVHPADIEIGQDYRFYFQKLNPNACSRVEAL